MTSMANGLLRLRDRGPPRQAQRSGISWAGRPGMAAEFLPRRAGRRGRPTNFPPNPNGPAMTQAYPQSEQAPGDDALSAMLDRNAIVHVVTDWALFRDAGRWDQLRRLFADGAVIHTTWFAGSAEEFVERSIEAKKRGARAQHFMGAATVDIAGDRAVAETPMILMLRAAVEGVPVDVTCHGRFYDRFVRERGSWRILLREPIYEKDRIDAVQPGQAIPLDAARLSQFAEGYRHVAYVQSLGGASLVPGLRTAGSAEDAALCAEGAAWLREQR